MRKLLAFAFLTVAAASNAAIYTMSGAGFGIVDNTTQSSSASFSGLAGTISSLDSVEVFGITHTWVGDLTARLNYGGQIFTLFHRPTGSSTSAAGSNNNFAGAGLVFNLSTATTIDSIVNATTTANIPSGTYRAAHQTVENQTTAVGNNPVLSNHSIFNGLDPNGSWNLSITDSAAGDVGSISGWRATGTYNAVPEPATMAALGLGVAALLRRRRQK